MIFDDILSNPYFYLYILIGMLPTVVSAKLYTYCFKSKYSDMCTIVCFCLSFGIVPIVYKVIVNRVSFLSPILGIICPAVVCFFITHGSKVKIVFFFIINLLLESISEIIIHALFGDNDISVSVYNPARIMATVLFLIISSPIKYIFASIWKKLVNKEDGIKLNYFFVVFPFAQGIAYIAMMLQYFNHHLYSLYSADHVSVYLSNEVDAAMMIFASSNIIFLIFISDFEKKRKLEQEVKTIKCVRSFEERHYEIIEKKRFEAAKLNHDIKNQIIIMKKLITAGKINEANQLINELEQNIDSTIEYD